MLVIVLNKTVVMFLILMLMFRVRMLLRKANTTPKRACDRDTFQNFSRFILKYSLFKFGILQPFITHETINKLLCSHSHNVQIPQQTDIQDHFYGDFIKKSRRVSNWRFGVANSPRGGRGQT